MEKYSTVMPYLDEKPLQKTLKDAKSTMVHF